MYEVTIFGKYDHLNYDAVLSFDDVDDAMAYYEAAKKANGMAHVNVIDVMFSAHVISWDGNEGEKKGPLYPIED